MTDAEPVRRKTSDETLLELEAAINAHFRTLWEESDRLNPGDYIPDWAVVVHYVDLTDDDEGPMTAGYTMETRRRMPPHSIRGLLEEGLDWLADQRMSDD